MKKTEVKRSVRVAERVQAELMGILLEGQVRDPGVSGVTVNAIKVTEDLRIAKVYVRLLEADPSDDRKKALLAGLERAKGFLRRELGQRLKLKHTPELRFYWDDLVDEANQIETLLAEMREDGEEA